MNLNVIELNEPNVDLYFVKVLLVCEKEIFVLLLKLMCYNGFIIID